MQARAPQVELVTEVSVPHGQTGASFVGELMAGRFRFELLELLELGRPERLGFWRLITDLHEFLQTTVDPIEIDRRGEIPSAVRAGLAELGVFGLTIPLCYEGLGLPHGEFLQVMQLLGGYDANLAAMISAHLTMGLIPALAAFGTECQKHRFLRRCARGAISAFAFTDPPAKFEPARLDNRAWLSADGSHYVLDGDAAWCIDGALAELLLVVARDPRTDEHNAFIVETRWPGVVVEHRCHFMGLRGLASGFVGFHGVRIPRSHRLGPVGAGLRVAELALDHRRSALPATLVGVAKACMEAARSWSIPRFEGDPAIAEREAIAWRNAELACSTLAMESVVHVIGELVEGQRPDAQLEVAAARQLIAKRSKELMDGAIAACDGLGYETARSSVERGGPPLCVERALRDSRVSSLFDGADETMHQTLARAALDEQRRQPPALAPLAEFLHRDRRHGWARWPRYRAYGRLATHLRFVARRTRRLGRALARAARTHGSALEHRSALLSHLTDIVLDLFATSAIVLYAHRLCEHKPKTGAIELADMFAWAARERIDAGFHAMWRDDDDARYELGRALLGGRCRWLGTGVSRLTAAPVQPATSSVLELIVTELDRHTRAPDDTPRPARDADAPVPREIDEWVKTQVFAGAKRNDSRPVLVPIEREDDEPDELSPDELALAGLGRARRLAGFLALLLGGSVATSS